MKKVVFVGNPNVGKSTLINLLCGSNLKIGNWSGVTTEKLEASFFYGEEEYLCVDLPGLYGFSNATDEERITEEYLMNHEIDCLVNVVDSTALLNNLNCTLQCRDLQIPMVLVLNFDDERIKSGIEIDAKWIARRLSIPTIMMHAHNDKRISYLKECIHTQADKTIRYLPLLDNATEKLFVDFYNQNYNDLRSAIFNFNQQYQEFVVENRRKTINSFKEAYSQNNPKLLVLTKRIDTYLLHVVYGYLFAFIICASMFYIVFTGSTWINNALNILLNAIKNVLVSIVVDFPILFQNLLIDGIWGAFCSVLNIVPILALLYAMLALLEESGYMARISLLCDRFMRNFHLSGKTMLCFIIGTGCNVPGIASTVSLENEKMRKKAALLIPFMSCSARLPIYIYFINIFFIQHQVLVLLIIYGLSFIVVCSLSIFLDIKEKNYYDDVMLVELPSYRFPKVAVVINKVKKEIKQFMTKALKVVLWILLILWILMNTPYGPTENSYLVTFAKNISPLFNPLGFGQYWFLVAALLPSFIAKESVVAFLILLNPDLTLIEHAPQIALSYMVFCLCSVPCVMTCSIMLQKYGFKHFLKSLLLTLIVPYLLSFFIYQFLLIVT